MRKFVLTMLPVALIAAIAVGCGGGSSNKTINIPGGGQVSVSGKVPSGFPSDFPVYKGADVQGSYTGQEGGLSGTVVIWQTSDSVDKVTSYFNDQFKSGNWKSNGSGTAAGTSYWSVENSDGSKVGYIGVTNSDNNTMISVIVSDKPAGSDSGSSSSSASATDTPSSDNSSSSDSSSSNSSGSSSAGLPDAVTLASDFPKDRVPFPDNTRVTSSSSYSSGGQTTYVIELYVKDSASNVNDYFKNEMPKHNWQDAFSGASAGEYTQTYSGATPTSGGQGEALTITMKDSDVSGYALVDILVSVGS